MDNGKKTILFVNSWNCSAIHSTSVSARPFYCQKNIWINMSLSINNNNLLKCKYKYIIFRSIGAGIKTLQPNNTKDSFSSKYLQIRSFLLLHWVNTTKQTTTEKVEEKIHHKINCNFFSSLRLFHRLRELSARKPVKNWKRRIFGGEKCKSTLNLVNIIQYEKVCA